MDLWYYFRSWYRQGLQSRPQLHFRVRKPSPILLQHRWSEQLRYVLRRIHRDPFHRPLQGKRIPIPRHCIDELYDAINNQTIQTNKKHITNLLIALILVFPQVSDTGGGDRPVTRLKKH